MRYALWAIAMIGGSPGCAQIFGLDDPRLVAPTDANGDGARVDGVVVDSFIDASSSGCPNGFVALLAATGHKYRLLTTPANWPDQQQACALLSSAAYLAIPDSQQELDAMVAFANNTFWIGVQDATTEGTYVTVLGTTQTFLPWASGEPTGSSQDCVYTDNSKLFYDIDCGSMLNAMCECVP